MTEIETLQATIKRLETELYDARRRLYPLLVQERAEKEAAERAIQERNYARLRERLNDDGYLRDKIAALPFREHNQFFGNYANGKIDSLFYVTDSKTGWKFYASRIWTAQDTYRLKSIIESIRDARKEQYTCQ